MNVSDTITMFLKGRTGNNTVIRLKQDLVVTMNGNNLRVPTVLAGMTPDGSISINFDGSFVVRGFSI